MDKQGEKLTEQKKTMLKDAQTTYDEILAEINKSFQNIKAVIEAECGSQAEAISQAKQEINVQMTQADTEINFTDKLRGKPITVKSFLSLQESVSNTRESVAAIESLKDSLSLTSLSFEPSKDVQKLVSQTFSFGALNKHGTNVGFDVTLPDIKFPIFLKTSSSGIVGTTQHQGSSAGKVGTTQHQGSSTGIVGTTQHQGSSAGTDGTTQHQGSSAGIVGTTQHQGSSAGIVGTTQHQGSSAGIVGTTQHQGSSDGIVGTTQHQGSSAGIVGTTQHQGSSAGIVGTTLHQGSSAGIVGTTQHQGSSAGIVGTTHHQGSSAGIVGSTQHQGSSAGIVGTTQHQGSSAGTVGTTQHHGSSVGTVGTTKHKGSSAGTVGTTKHKGTPRPGAQRVKPTQQASLGQMKATQIGTLNIKTDEDNRKCSITGITITPSGQRLVVDSNNWKVKLFSPDMTFLSSESLPRYPWDITMVNDTEAVVTVDQYLVFLEVTDTQLRIKHKIEMPFNCYGITHSNGKLFVTDSEKLHALDLRGTKLWSVGQSLFKSLFQSALYLSSNSDGRWIAVTDYDKKTITILDTNNGRVITSRQLKNCYGLLGVSVDMSDNIFVCATPNTVVLSSDLKNEQVLFNNEGDFPKAIAYDKMKHQLIISQLSNDSVRCLQLS